MNIIQRLLPAVLCAAAMTISGAVAPLSAVAQVPCGMSTYRSADQSHPGQFSPESGPCDDSLQSAPPAQAPHLILPPS